MLVKELMSTNICFVNHNAKIIDAMRLMKQFNIGIVPVCDEQVRLIGVVTDRDIVLYASDCNSSDFPENPIIRVMSENIIATTPDTDLHNAALLFSKHHLHRLPVLQNHRLVGMLSLSDLARKKIFLAEVGCIFHAIAKN